MPALTRRRDPEGHQEIWHVYYGDVKVGTIGIRAGVSVDVDPWGWSCGFYPMAGPQVAIFKNVFTREQTAEFAPNKLTVFAKPNGQDP
jgi:hypothetical protein